MGSIARTLANSISDTGTVSSGVNYRNIIINGDMVVAQRGSSFSSVSAGNGTYPVDRFRNNMTGAGTWTISQSTDVPSGQGFAKSIKYDCTTANGSLSAGDFLILQQLLEGQMLQYLKKGTSSAESLTLSFWVKSNKTGTYIAELYDEDNSRMIQKSYTVDSASTWEKKTLTYAGDTTGTLTNDSGSSLTLNMWLAAGSNFTGGLTTSWGSAGGNRAQGQVNLADNTANEWYITGVQLEVGTSATDFEFLPLDVNEKRCFRYYQHMIAANTYPNGIITSSDSNYLSCSYPYMGGPMRANPTLQTGNIDAINASGTTTITSGIGGGLSRGWYLGANSGNFGSNTLHRVNFVYFGFSAEL